mmetsp:Transcript_99413/g.319001  ORF Transcript_99413/g.319001 Transcript_99413/m.319001 type:complete len:646 (-) Transcript_99413:144-2081(-)
MDSRVHGTMPWPCLAQVSPFLRRPSCPRARVVRLFCATAGSSPRRLPMGQGRRADAEVASWPPALLGFVAHLGDLRAAAAHRGAGLTTTCAGSGSSDGASASDGTLGGVVGVVGAFAGRPEAEDGDRSPSASSVVLSLVSAAEGPEALVVDQLQKAPDSGEAFSTSPLGAGGGDAAAVAASAAAACGIGSAAPAAPGAVEEQRFARLECEVAVLRQELLRTWREVAELREVASCATESAAAAHAAAAAASVCAAEVGRREPSVAPASAQPGLAAAAVAGQEREAAQATLERLERESETTRQMARRLEAQAEQWRNEVRSTRELRRGVGEHLEQLRHRATAAQSQLEALLERQAQQPPAPPNPAAQGRGSGSGAAEAGGSAAAARRVQTLEGAVGTVQQALARDGNRTTELEDRMLKQETMLEAVAADVLAAALHQLESQDVAISGFERVDTVMEAVRLRAEAAYALVEVALGGPSRGASVAASAAGEIGSAISSAAPSLRHEELRPPAAPAPQTMAAAAAAPNEGQPLSAARAGGLSLASAKAVPRSSASAASSRQTSPRTSPRATPASSPSGGGHRSVHAPAVAFGGAPAHLADARPTPTLGRPSGAGRGVASKSAGGLLSSLHAPPPSASSAQGSASPALGRL